ncbi:TPA: MBL fold metallo-hydrolase [Streptococcus suis]|uniref:MBL fold metallo-hydrolase n=1 Tax=Streptococcus TaxID=1301 RepID=UPI000CF51E93|nr:MULTISPECIES: MBL fold metallo-hydrolase [Streptococcus]MBM7192320.1 MBL fold metallo-hydrolase [Streptococcus suis]MBO4111467.1 MBL fold metallo-hydrolase [Streptococcus suis]MBS8056268.1 MBL fold metallo-hydrolase [Streptococcus suis]MBS8070974.1 MBL fold metallo-hydrolase [Streptococcus suis]MBS8085891.1 MBL fold metallo-hydrolase [Streptococcus suis]
MSCVKREILPVGQGAFYLETLMLRGNEYRVIYDCGSATDVTYVETQIKANLNKNEEIHAVFISHLDDDHVNGLEFLLKHCNVKNLFFPLITKQTKQFNAIRNLINPQSRFLTQFINSEGNSIRELEGGSEVQLHPISEDASNDNRVIEVTQAIFGSNYRKLGWIYLPHNFREDTRKQIFETELKKISLSMSILDLNGQVDLQKLKKLWSQGTNSDKSEIKKAYSKVPGSLNVNSMMLYSGADLPFNGCSNKCRLFSCIYHHNGNYEYICFNGCLYTGDYESGKYDWNKKKWISCKQKWDSVENVYSKYFRNIGLVQIPHHGSRHNYNEGFRKKINFAAYFASAGKHNRYRHPHKEVLVDLISNQKCINTITEDANSKMTYYCHW